MQTAKSQGSHRFSILKYPDFPLIILRIFPDLFSIVLYINDRFNTKLWINNKAYTYHETNYFNVTHIYIANFVYNMTCDVSQGSILGPNLYEDYTTVSIGSVFRKHQVFHHIYADDTHGYLPFHTHVEEQELQKLIGLCA